MTLSGRNFVALAVGALPILAQEPAKTESLVRLDAKYVCFVAKHRFDKEQWPVAVEGKTYYGCCDMCKAKLKEAAAQRCDIDPVSGAKVDKASTVSAQITKARFTFLRTKAI